MTITSILTHTDIGDITFGYTTSTIRNGTILGYNKLGTYMSLQPLLNLPKVWSSRTGFTGL